MTHVSERDRGAAMIMVLGMISMMTVVVAAAELRGQCRAASPPRRELAAALAAAQAGVDDHLAKLNRTDAYALTVDCSNDALQGPKAETNTWMEQQYWEPGWVNVQAGNAAAGKFHYDVNTRASGKTVGLGRVDRQGPGSLPHHPGALPVGARPTSCITRTSRTPTRRISWPTTGRCNSLSTGEHLCDECGRRGRGPRTGGKGTW